MYNTINYNIVACDDNDNKNKNNLTADTRTPVDVANVSHRFISSMSKLCVRSMGPSNKNKINRPTPAENMK